MITESDLAALLEETAARHHDAYQATDGYDPEWPVWYADYLAERLNGRFEHPPPPDELEPLLREADRRFTAGELASEEWPAFYARHFVASWTNPWPDYASGPSRE